VNVSPDARLTRFADGTVHFNAAIDRSLELHQDGNPQVDLEIVQQTLTDYRYIFKENPVGTENAEIVSHLLGSNPRNVVFLDPASPALSPQKELLDRWGSPFVFHPLTAQIMDVRSLGPDRKLWTDDDLSLDVEETEDELFLYPPTQ
jgi:hypothetical protein